MIFCPGVELKKVQTVVSKHLGIFPKIRGGGNSARVSGKTATSAALIVFLVYGVMWYGDSVKCDGLWCDMACSLVVLWWIN